MKQIEIFLGKALLALSMTGMALGATGCSEDPIDEEDPRSPESQMPTFYDAETSLDVPVYISSMPDGLMGQVIGKRFVNRASVDEAPLCIFNDSDVASSLDAIDAAYSRGAVIAILNPSLNSTDLLQAMGHPISPASDPALLMAYDKINEYEISGDGVFKLADEEQPEHGEEWEKYISETFTDKDPHYEALSDNFDCFIEWANKELGIGSKTRAGNQEGPAEIWKYLSKSDSFYHYIDKMIGSDRDWLSGSWDCDVTYSVRPTYIYEVNNDAAGDYYSVEADVVLRNNRLWHADYNKHGAFRTYMIGYYMRTFDIEFKLLDDNGNPLPGVRFYRYPFPAANINTQSVSDGFSQGLNVSGTPSFEMGNDGGIKGGLSLTAGYSCNWSHSTSYSLPDVSVGVSTAGGASHYTFTVNSAQNWPCDWDKRNSGSAYPALCRNEMHFNLHWIWKVPAGTNGVKDDAKTKFKIYTSGWLNYGVSHYFNQAGHSDHHKDWSDVSFNHTASIPAINRTRFGTIAISNNSQAYSMGNFKFYKAGTKELVNSIDRGVNYNQTARYNFYVGDYDMTYDLINGNTNKVVSSWRISNIKVRQGRNEEASTVYVTSTMGEQY